MEFILEHKWAILLTSEISAWVFTLLMAYARYYLQSNVLFIISTVIVGFTGWAVYLILPILEAIHLGGISEVFASRDAMLFNAFIIFLLIFGVIIGKKYLRKIDLYFMNLAKRQSKSN